ncbi:L,D-transpeptidase family protein [Rhizobium sp. CSW-27]|uniref:L,D-transpeptidase family protein n=1 Tax=Rhizobium sp. CSW-27 TaxID=2839985 RepID=UPI001C026ECE|nr:L,D-transpeptidase family protein [Rhizobium sp. CSW-27]MBT9368283.1 L,D-transpeptidase family protein [Rhizobium sp. CSW-27]
MPPRLAARLLLLATVAISSSAADAADRHTLQIIVSRQTQSLAVYEDGVVVATSHVSTGKAGHETPTGIFSVLQKARHHKSNIYSDAPMPWMQRLTWSGIALHESSSVPAFPASHGCVRLPAEFARSLYGMTGIGTHVVISDAPVAPRPVRHATLFQPLPAAPPQPQLTDAPERHAALPAGDDPVDVALNTAHADTLPAASPDRAARADEPPVRILITRRTERDEIADIQAMLSELGFDAGTADGIMGPATRQALAGYKRWKGLPETGAQLAPALVSALRASAGRDRPPAGKLIVRQNFADVLSEPVDFDAPQVALGTHFLSIVRIEPASRAAAWQGLSLPNDLSPEERQRLGITQEAPDGPQALQTVLDRLHVPAELQARIGALLTTGASLTITDTGTEKETTKGTDFITLTHRGHSALDL